MERARVVAVQGPDGPGSGYVIAPRLVLTSAHVVPPSTGAVSLFRPGQADSWDSVVVWRGTPGGRDDAALVRIEDPAWVPLPGVSVRWGRLATDRSGTPCETWGLPELVQRAGQAADTLQPSGTLNPGDRQVGNRYVMSLGQHPPDSSTGGASPWGGLSGAALFCGDLLAGVIASDPAGRAHAHLEAVPTYVLLHDQSFVAALTEHGENTGSVLEPVEWQHLAEAADPATTGPARSPAALLRARRQIVPFRGRTELLSQLEAWTKEPGFGALLLHGPGGQGKTRLAQHLADTLASERWAILWLRPDATPETLHVLAAAAVPLLVVVDYAETRSPQTIALLEAAARHHTSSGFKVLLLARTAGDWWTTLHATSPLAEDLLDGADIILLPALEPEPGQSRTKAYQEAVRGYTHHLPHVRGWQHHDWPALAARLQDQTHGSGSARLLDRPGAETVLTLHMTALADLLETAGPSAVADSGSEVVATPPEKRGVEDRLLVHEERYWTNAATTRGLHPQLTMVTLTDALAAAFLLGADDRDQADALLERVPGLNGQPKDRRGAVRDWIAALYPPAAPGRPWDALQPDRLAERFIGRRLEADPHLADTFLPDATTHQVTQMLTVCTRAAAHAVFHHRLDQHLTALCVRHAYALATPAINVATQTEAPQPLLDALQHITDIPDIGLAELQQLANVLPDASHNLAPWAAHLTQLITEHHRALTHTSSDHLPDLAMSLNNLSIRLGDLGRREEGLDAITEAAQTYRKLTKAQPDAYLPDLAMSLNNLSIRLGDLGRREEGLDAITEAAQTYRKLTKAQPDAYLPDLAMSLNNLSIRLGDLGRREEGLDAITEAVEIRRKLAKAQPDAYLPNLAMSLNNLSNRLGDLGRREEGLDAITEAVEIRRKLAKAQPDAYLPNLASSLNNLSNRLADLGRREEALDAITEAAQTYRKLAKAQPDAYLPDLASSLNNLSIDLGNAERREEGLDAITEAVEIRRKLAKAQPDAYLPNLASSLNNLSIDLGNAERREDALKAITEAVQIYQDLARARPEVHQTELDEALQILAWLQSDVKSDLPRFVIGRSRY
ncbi:tetratricopeptide repeat protein (plasmid) [Streptomyces sp. Qhu-G9]|uniref:tetratricopeptide repeat protein n=1 Tax=Streptomyces sp. Qhu-G9 TaxID=3452799 RepID=UPI0022AC64E7|nr:tetratricopeptide repeat protein [Streptomyces aurantiacus]WAU78376.1 tetratricopeptide repeat protein [Streptomyces aurantiacus]